MRAAELRRRLASLMEITEGEVDQRSRFLNELDQFRSGRGINAPHLKPYEAALLILCLVSRRTVDAQAAATRAMKLNVVARPGERPVFVTDSPAGGLTLAIGMLLDNPDAHKDYDVERVEIHEDGGFASITLKGRRWIFTDDPETRDAIVADKAAYEACGQDRISRALVIGAKALRELAEEIDGNTGYRP